MAASAACSWAPLENSKPSTDVAAAVAERPWLFPPKPRFAAVFTANRGRDVASISHLGKRTGGTEVAMRVRPARVASTREGQSIFRLPPGCSPHSRQVARYTIGYWSSQVRACRGRHRSNRRRPAKVHVPLPSMDAQAVYPEQPRSCQRRPLRLRLTANCANAYRHCFSESHCSSGACVLDPCPNGRTLLQSKNARVFSRWLALERYRQ